MVGPMQRHGLKVKRIPTESLKERPGNLFDVLVVVATHFVNHIQPFPHQSSDTDVVILLLCDAAALVVLVSCS